MGLHAFVENTSRSSCPSPVSRLLILRHVTLPSTDRLDHVIASTNCHFDSIQTHLEDRSLNMPVGSYLDCLHNVGRPALFTV